VPVHVGVPWHVKLIVVDPGPEEGAVEKEPEMTSVAFVASALAAASAATAAQNLLLVIRLPDLSTAGIRLHHAQSGGF
jgi:hypothetical protein